MGFSVDFTDNKSISAEDLNNIIAEIGEDGVSASSEFVSGSLFYTDKLNCIRSEIVTGGIRSGCEATLCDTGVIIGEGLCFFDSGMRMKIDAEGITLVTVPETENFVYLYASPNSNTATAVVTTAEKTGAEYVPICRIDENGILHDTREWCQAKIPMMNSRFIQSEELVFEYAGAENNVIIASVPMINKTYSYIVISCQSAMVLYCRDTNKFSYIVTNGSYGSFLRENAESMVLGYNSNSTYNARISIKEEDGCINFYTSASQVKKTVKMLVI